VPSDNFLRLGIVDSGMIALSICRLINDNLAVNHRLLKFLIIFRPASCLMRNSIIIMIIALVLIALIVSALTLIAACFLLAALPCRACITPNRR
jgi:hypothetical protein